MPTFTKLGALALTVALSFNTTLAQQSVRRLPAKTTARPSQKSDCHFLCAGARGSYHLGEALNVQSRDFDPYIGATLGFRYAGAGRSYGYSDGYGYNSGLYVGIHLGARMMFSPDIGAFAKVGYGVSAVKLGLAAKF